MLDQLHPFLTAEKRTDLVSRLNNKRIAQCLPAQMETAISWAYSGVPAFEIEPEWWSSKKRPDIHLFTDKGPCVIDITALSDNTMSAEDDMHTWASKAVEHSNTFRKGSGKFLYFRFGEIRRKANSRSERIVAVPKGGAISEYAISSIKNWISSCPATGDQHLIHEDNLKVEIKYARHKQIPYHNFSTSRPPRTYSLTDNPIYSSLREKSAQLSGAAAGTLRAVVMADIGSKMLREIGDRRSNIENYADAGSIINNFIHEYEGSIDCVIVISPKSPNSSNLQERSVNWHITYYSLHNQSEAAFLSENLLKNLPKPRMEGYQARSLFFQKGFDPSSRGWWIGCEVTRKMSEETFKISARALQDFLGRRISEEVFRRAIGDMSDGPSIWRALDRGLTIKEISLEDGGIDRDDDLVVVKLSPDPSAKKFE